MQSRALGSPLLQESRLYLRWVNNRKKRRPGFPADELVPRADAFDRLTDFPPPVVHAHGESSHSLGVSRTTVDPAFSKRMVPCCANFASVDATSESESRNRRHAES